MKSSEALIGPYANLMNDIAFQWVFGKESNKDLLLLLLNEFITDRCLYYSTFSLQGQIREGDDDYTLKPVYVVSIDDFARPHSQEWDGRVLSSYSLREDENHELMTDSLHFVFVELSYFKKKWEDIDNDKERLYFCLKHLHEMDDLPDWFAEGIWAKLADQARIVEMELEIKKQYIRIMETEIDKRAQLTCFPQWDTHFSSWLR